MGEVTESPRRRARTGREYSFFIYDTENVGYFDPADADYVLDLNYFADLSEAEFEYKLKELELWEEVELVDRSSRMWLKQQQ